MHASRSPLSRPRSRSQWDEYYRNFHIERKGKKVESRSLKVNNQVSGSTNVVDSESIVGDENDFVSFAEKRKLKEKIEGAESCRTSVKRTKNGTETRKEEVGGNDTFAGRVLSGKKKLDFIAKSDGDGDGDGALERSGEEVVSNGSSLKIKQESVCVSVDLKNSTESESSDGQDTSEYESEAESTSEEDNEVSDDEDYVAANEPSASDDDDSDDSYDVEQRNDENDGMMKVEKENSSTEDEKMLHTSRMHMKESDPEEKDDEIDEGYNGSNDNGTVGCKRSSNEEKRKENVIVVIDDKKSTIVCGKKGDGINKQERDNENDEGYNGDNDDFDGISCCKRSSNQEKHEEDVIILVDNEGKLYNVSKSTRTLRKKRHEIPFDGMGSRNKRSADNKTEEDDVTVSLNVCKNVKHNTNESFVKKRNVLGSDVSEEKNSNVKEGSSVAKRLRSSTFSKNGPQLGKYTDPAPILESDESTSSMDDDENREEAQHCLKNSPIKKNHRVATDLDLIKILLESINSENPCPIDDSDDELPLKFRFEDEIEPPPEKSEWEKQMDLLFCDLELGLRESEMECNESCVKETVEPVIDTSPAACCGRGEHHSVLDEQIGIVCKYCTAIIMDIKYILPPFYKPPPRKRDRKDFDESPTSVTDQIHFEDSMSKNHFSTTRAKGTVWDLIPGVANRMYPHQIEGFEFMWRNIAGDIIIEKLERPLPQGGSGCIISHAPGTGKTRLAIVFLQAFLKMYPACYPVIIAPRGMLLTWESELRKWKVDIPFHNLNKRELTGKENDVAASIFRQLGCGSGGRMSQEFIRVLKLYSWRKGRSILGVSYNLFEKLAGENVKKGLSQQIKKLLHESPGLLVLDEGHTPRNDQSLIWKALAKVTTMRRIILSGTPFQNNLTELYNTLCLVNPKFANQMESVNNNRLSRETRGRKASVTRKKWSDLTSSIGSNTNNGLKKLKVMLDPFVHVHKGTILEESLPGLRDTLVFLHPTEFQRTLLEMAKEESRLFSRIHLVSLISVHPSLLASLLNANAFRRLSPSEKSKLEEMELNENAGVKMSFVMKLIRLAGALGERVLVFSQYIDPLIFMKKRITSHFSWNEGKEVLYMDGQLDERHRQESISSFNDETSEAKVLLASKKACSEGINLIGASRVVLLDTVWNPSVEKQAISRAYRLGQKRVVYVYHLCTSGTEVGIYAQQVKKERISELIFSSVDRQNCPSSPDVWEDRVLESMLDAKGFSHVFAKVIPQPKESDLVEIFGLGDHLGFKG